MERDHGRWVRRCMCRREYTTFTLHEAVQCSPVSQKANLIVEKNGDFKNGAGVSEFCDELRTLMMGLCVQSFKCLGESTEEAEKLRMKLWEMIEPVSLFQPDAWKRYCRRLADVYYQEAVFHSTGGSPKADTHPAPPRGWAGVQAKVMEMKHRLSAKSGGAAK